MSKRVAIYTSITGGYDHLLQPHVLSDEYDFICFVGRGEKRAEHDGVWEIRELEFEAESPQLVSRYAKMHPHLLLPEYEASVWIDGNIEILDGSLYEAARLKLASGETYCGVPHPSRDCVYAEAKKCRDMRYISYPRLLVIWATLFLHGVPRHAGMMENNLIFRRHLDPVIVRFDELWWERVMHFCRRDQLSFLWTVRECGVKVGFLLPDGQNTRNHPGFKYLLHR